MRRAAILLCVPVAIAIVAALPMGMHRGAYQWLCAATAVALTVTPAIITFLIAERMATGSAVGRVAVLVLGPVVRLFIGFGGATAVFFGAGETFRTDPISYWGWVLGLYLITLIVETALLGRQELVANPGARGTSLP